MAKMRTGTDFHQRGRQNRAEGVSFEQKISGAFEYYKARGYAQVDKTPEPTKPIKRLDGGKFVAVFDRRAQPDYKGTIKGGRSVMFEAKYTAADRMPDGRVTEAQWKYLEQAAKLGAWCYVLAGFGSGSVFKIPWEIWEDMQSYFGRKYIRETDPQLQQYKVDTAWNGHLMIFGVI